MSRIHLRNQVKKSVHKTTLALPWSKLVNSQDSRKNGKNKLRDILFLLSVGKVVTLTTHYFNYSMGLT